MAALAPAVAVPTPAAALPLPLPVLLERTARALQEAAPINNGAHGEGEEAV